LSPLAHRERCRRQQRRRQEIVRPGGIADATVVSSGGTLGVVGGGTDFGAQISGGIEIESGLANGGTAVATAISGGTVEVASGGISRPELSRQRRG
jgi:hypothetical protein